MEAADQICLHTYKGRKYTYMVLSRKAIMDMALDVPHIVISASDPHMPEPEIPCGRQCLGILRLRFHDIDTPIARMRIMSVRDARRIVSFVRRHLSSARAIVCQCDSGVSRSAGVCAALMLWLEGYEDQLVYENHMPSDKVRRMVLEAAREDATQ